MKGGKINEQALEQVVGGVISDGGITVSVKSGQMVGVKDNVTLNMSVADFKDTLADEGCSQDGINKFMEMTESTSSYSFKQIKAATGIDIEGALNKQFAN